MMSGETIADAIVRTKSRSTGFDYLRIVLAVAVLLWHSYRVTNAGASMTPVVRAFAGPILPMFFALSGFLISGSLVRSRSIHEFIMLRVIRILPALSVETVISLVLIGSFFTTLSLAQFYAHPVTHHYLYNMVGHVQLRLPGVFEDLPFPRIVNLSLWTVPFELRCYLLIVLLWFTRLVSQRYLLLAAALILPVLLYFHDVQSGQVMGTLGRVSGNVLVICFLCGIVVYQFREKLVLSLPLFIASLAVAEVMLLSSFGSYLVALPLAYATVYLGMLNPPKVPVLLNGDYSYGVYLYAFPVQQAVVSLFPAYRIWWVNAAIALPVVAILAAFSWHAVEKPIMHRRKHIIGLTDRIVDRLMGRKTLRPDPAAVSVLDAKSGA